MLSCLFLGLCMPTKKLPNMSSQLKITDNMLYEKGQLVSLIQQQLIYHCNYSKNQLHFGIFSLKRVDFGNWKSHFWYFVEAEIEPNPSSTPMTERVPLVKNISLYHLNIFLVKNIPLFPLLIFKCSTAKTTCCKFRFSSLIILRALRKQNSHLL